MPIANGEATGHTTSGHSSAERQAAGNMLVCCCRRMINIMIAMKNVMPKASRSPVRCPSAAAPLTMMPTPSSAKRLAASKAHASLTPSHSQPRPAVRNGAAAKITATSATDVRRNAFRYSIVAAVEHSAATKPGRPTARMAATVRPRSCTTITHRVIRPANKPRQNNMVHASRWISRVKNPAELYAIAERTISRTP
jgi:hypothetical protein